MARKRKSKARKRKSKDADQLGLLEARVSTAPCVPGIRKNVEEWREGGYKGVSDTTSILLNYWFKTDHRPRGGPKFAYHYFQREASRPNQESTKNRTAAAALPFTRNRTRLDLPACPEPGSRQHKTHEVLSPRNVCLPVDQEAVRADTYRRRAVALAEQARREDDKGQRRFLIDQARSLISAADAIDPPPPPRMMLRRCEPN